MGNRVLVEKGMQDLIDHKMLVIWCGGFMFLVKMRMMNVLVAASLELEGSSSSSLAAWSGGCHLNLCGALEHFPNRGGGAF